MNPHVLVVDDDQGIRTLLSALLAGEGMSVHTAANGREAWDAIQVRPPSFFAVVVLDLQMPVMDGRAFGRKLHEAHIDVPILLLSAYGAETAAREVGAAGVLTKPFDVDSLIQEVERLALSKQQSHPTERSEHVGTHPSHREPSAPVGEAVAEPPPIY